MKALQQRILQEGKNLGNGILKVDGFVNHQVDPALMEACGKEFAHRFASVGATKVLTAEISGIAPALTTAIHLGLPVVYGIVKDHGGTTEAKSRKGSGTIMSIYLPISDQLVEEIPTMSAEMQGGTETLLLVEDQPMLLELGRKALTALGYRVLTAQDGVEALKIFADYHQKIALTILDVVMPCMGGIEAAKELTRLKPELAVLLTSGYSDSGKYGEEIKAYEFL